MASSYCGQKGFRLCEGISSCFPRSGGNHELHPGSQTRESHYWNRRFWGGASRLRVTMGPI